jgi:hypothetical protein
LTLKYLPHAEVSLIFDTSVSPVFDIIMGALTHLHHIGCTTHTHTQTHTNTHKHTYTHMNTRLYAYLYSYRVHFITTTNYGGLKTDLQTEWEFVADIHINRV